MHSVQLKLAGWVDGPFVWLAWLKTAASIDHPWVKLLLCSPNVKANRRVEATFDPTRHFIDVSDSHPVASHPVKPDFTLLQ